MVIVVGKHKYCGWLCLGARCVISWSSYGLNRGIPCHFFFSLLLLILFLHKNSNISYHDTGDDQLSVQHKGGLVSVALGERFARSWISYGLKQGISCQILFLSILLILCLPNVSNSPIITQEKINCLKNT